MFAKTSNQIGCHLIITNGLMGDMVPPFVASHESVDTTFFQSNGETSLANSPQHFIGAGERIFRTFNAQC